VRVDLSIDAELPRLCLRRVIDWIAPPQCLSCATPVREPAALCPQCWTKLNFIEQPCCDRLGIPLPYDQGDGAISAAAAADPALWDKARTALAYDDASRPIVQALKYHDRHEASLLMARLMLRAGANLLHESEMIVPVPLHPWRLWRRRFNQSGLLAQRIARQAGLPYRPDILLRLKHTRPQVGLDQASRRKNVRRAFVVADQRRPEVYGKSIVLVDDVVTTGATAAACTEALRQAGAARVHVLTFALVLEPRRLHI
jgi:ComF family protein